MGVYEILAIIVVVALLIALVLGKLRIKRIQSPFISLDIDDESPIGQGPSNHNSQQLQFNVILPEPEKLRPSQSLYESMSESDKITAHFLADVDLRKHPNDEWFYKSED